VQCACTLVQTVICSSKRRTTFLLTLTLTVYLKHAGTDAGMALMAADASSAVPSSVDAD